MGQLPVVEEAAVGAPAPGAQVDLVDVQWRVVDGVGMPVLQPLLVAPLVAVDGAELAGGAGAGFRVEGVGVRLVAQLPVRPGDGEFVGVIGLSAGDKDLPDPIGDLMHGVGPGIPEIEITHYGYSLCPRRPDAKHIAGFSVVGGSMRAHIFVRAYSRSLVEKVGIQLISISVGHSDPPWYWSQEEKTMRPC